MNTYSVQISNGNTMTVKSSSHAKALHILYGPNAKVSFVRGSIFRRWAMWSVEPHGMPALLVITTKA